MKYGVLIVAFLLVFRPVLPVLDYVVNYEYIATQLCENKDKPELKCHGKCHLMKEMAKTAETDKPTSPDKKSQWQEAEAAFLPTDFTTNIVHFYFSFSSKVNDNYSNLYFHLEGCSAFHPPTLLS